MIRRLARIHALALCAALALTALAGGVAAQQAADNVRRADTLAEFTYGPYCAQRPTGQQDAPDTAAGLVNEVPLPEIRRVQTLVPAEIGIAFGVVARPAPGADYGLVDVTVTHPPYPDSGIEVERWRAVLTSDGPSLFGFSFERPEELVTGDWTITVTADAGEEVLSVTFQVVPPTMAPGLAAACGLVPMS